MPGFTKLFADIVTSSIWSEDDKTRILWVTLLALCQRDGIVRAATTSLARVAGIDVESCERALVKFQEPDKESRSREFDGRRIERVEGGWRLLNYQKYREGRDVSARREYQRIKQAEYRSKRNRKTTISAENLEREKRFVEAHGNGDGAACDRIASENLPSFGH